MLAKRIIPCLDVRAGKVTKGVQFLANADVGDPVAMARYYYEQGADEIVFYDITASNEKRGIMLEVVRAVAREIFIRTRAPYRRLFSLYSEVRGRLEAAGVRPRGKCGPHAFRHARAVTLLRASVSRKVIGDLLGHRSEESTLPYLKLATEDLRAIALEIPEARS